MRKITLEELLEAGCHFGHQVSRQNPKTREFVFEARDNIHIIDLEKTKEGLEAAAEFIKEIAEKPESSILLIGTKHQASDVVKTEVQRSHEAGADNLFYVNARWMGGTLTNFTEIAKNYKKLKDLTSLLNNEYEKQKYTKKELSLWEKERQKLIMYYDGIKDMKKNPDVLFIIDTHMEDLAVREASSLGIPTVGMVDTNADPDPVTFPIPANDDAAGSISLITSYIIDAWIEGKKKLAKGTEQSAQGEDKKEKKATKSAEQREKGEKAEESRETKKTEGEKAAKSAEHSAKSSESQVEVKEEGKKEEKKVEKKTKKKA